MEHHSSNEHTVKPLNNGQVLYRFYREINWPFLEVKSFSLAALESLATFTAMLMAVYGL